MERAGIVLCGGRSRRMGRPKALLPWFGRRMVDHVVDRLAPCVDEIVVVTSAELARSLLEPSMRGSARQTPANDAAKFDPAAKRNVRHVVDREPERGPLAAIRDELAFVTSTDAPFLTPAHVDALLRAAADAGREGAPRAIVPRADGFLQVLSAVYPREAGREAEALLAAGSASPAALALRIDAQILEVPPTTGPSSWTGFNSPAEYLALARRVDPDATARVEWRIEGADAGRRGESDAGASGSGVSGERADGIGDRPDRDVARAVASTVREVPIGLLGEVLRAAAPRPGDVAAARGEGRLRVVLAEGELARDFDETLPIGPGEHVVVHERVRGFERARAAAR